MNQDTGDKGSCDRGISGKFSHGKSLQCNHSLYVAYVLEILFLSHRIISTHTNYINLKNHS